MNIIYSSQTGNFILFTHIKRSASSLRSRFFCEGATDATDARHIRTPNGKTTTTTKMMTMTMSATMRPSVRANKTATTTTTCRNMNKMMVMTSMPTRKAHVVRANEQDDAANEDDGFEERLSALRGKRSKRAAKDPSDAASNEGTTLSPMATAARAQSRAKGVRDFTVTDNVDEPNVNWGDETVIYEGPPARGEVVANVAMSWTLVWLPLTIQAVGRALWLNYKITDKRVSVVSTSPLRKERTDIPVDQIMDVVSIGRGIGAWGDMVITLRNGEKIELRSLPEYKKCEEAIREKMYKEKIIDF